MNENNKEKLYRVPAHEIYEVGLAKFIVYEDALKRLGAVPPLPPRELNRAERRALKRKK